MQDWFPTVPARLERPSRPVSVPPLLPVLGGLWWVVGSTALDAGVGTVVLALGLGATIGLVVMLRRRHGSGAPLPHGGRNKLVRLVVLTVALIVGGGVGLGYLGLGELAVPLACGLVAFALFPLAPLFDDRSLVALGAVLLVLAAVGAVLALDSAGRLYPQGVVGLVAGGLFWLTAALRGGLLGQLRAYIP